MPLLDGRIWRIPNPAFESRWSGPHDTAAKYLFEKTDALITAALNWGVLEAQLQATVARDELGRLRDARYVLPGIEAKNPEERFAALACLVFLPDTEWPEELPNHEMAASGLRGAIKGGKGMADAPFEQLEVDESVGESW